MRNIAYWPEANRLVYLEAKATPEFWDARWEKEGKPAEIRPNDDVIVVTRKHLPKGARVLEGGCGRANKVHALNEAGYDAVGIDFAEETVAQAKKYYDGIDVRRGDVRALEFDDASLDGYWSFGVIEHFWNGYDDILTEAARVLKPGGYLFLTAPWFSPLRQSKARSGGYNSIDGATEPADFYQFALGRDEVIAKLEKSGLQLEYWRGRVAEISMRDDMVNGRWFIDWLLGSRGSIVKRVIRRLVTRSLRNYCGHTFLAVARRAD